MRSISAWRNAFLWIKSIWVRRQVASSIYVANLKIPCWSCTLSISHIMTLNLTMLGSVQLSINLSLWILDSVNKTFNIMEKWKKKTQKVPFFTAVIKWKSYFLVQELDTPTCTIMITYAYKRRLHSSSNFFN